MIFSKNQITGKSIFSKTFTGIAAKRDIWLLYCSPIFLGIISEKIITRSVNPPETAPNHLLPSTDDAMVPTTILPPIDDRLVRITKVYLEGMNERPLKMSCPLATRPEIKKSGLEVVKVAMRHFISALQHGVSY